MFVELMANIKNERLNNLFRSTSNLQAFENFLASLPQSLLGEDAPTAPTASPDAIPGDADRSAGARTNIPGSGTRSLETEYRDYAIDPVRRSLPQVARN